MSRASTKAALDRFFGRQIKKDEAAQKPRRKNGKPEFVLTVIPCMDWLQHEGFSMNRIEAKAVWNAEAGRYLYGQTDAGVADAFGCCPDGTAAFIEFKAPGKRSTLKPHQRDWLLTKIEKGCFAICADSIESVRTQWIAFLALRLDGRHKDYLRIQIRPSSRLESDEPDALF